MSTGTSNETLSKSQIKRRKRAEKRKASSSPGTIQNDQFSPENRSPNLSVDSDIPYLLQNSKEYVQAVINDISPINYDDQYAAMIQGEQIDQPPLTPVTPVLASKMSTTPPPWAISLIEDVKTIKEALPKIYQIEQSRLIIIILFINICYINLFYLSLFPYMHMLFFFQ